jgi:hypothetical protein
MIRNFQTNLPYHVAILQWARGKRSIALASVARDRNSGQRTDQKSWSFFGKNIMLIATQNPIQSYVQTVMMKSKQPQSAVRHHPNYF